jgi:hypothetical protein
MRSSPAEENRKAPSLVFTALYQAPCTPTIPPDGPNESTFAAIFGLLAPIVGGTGLRSVKISTVAVTTPAPPTTKPNELTSPKFHAWFAASSPV